MVCCSAAEKSSALVGLGFFPFLMLPHKTGFIKTSVQGVLVSGEDGLFLQHVDSGHGVLFPLKNPSYELKLSCNQVRHNCSAVASFEVVERTDCEWTRTF